ncbi:3-oxoacyl-[acyl-carrier-protein] synthase homolog [[Candida] railenensis]|uniref:3-oxoacyl-[acyl-carrier-protein] synthase n=1 Tax=[Candida] railenensis TaxID=45579 RepID=A0A9P0VW19_9ASCO|nr:3-oxoacyl-[acyl-carrier-protein] synthase homolog [[Candida] railenensis]
MSRVVVTGLGLITPLGVGVKKSWSNLLANKSGLISTSTFPDYESAGWSSIPSQVVGKIPEGSIEEGKWSVGDHFEHVSDSRRIARFAQYALAATQEALTDANWFPKSDLDQTDTGVAVGSGIGSFDDSYTNAINFHEKGFKKVQPLFIPRLLSNMAAGNISIKYGIRGVNHSVSSACATGLHSIGDAYNFITLGHSKVMICGGTEASINPLALAGFARAKSVVVDSNDQPELASRPFDASRSGFVLSEGCGIVILEELEHALARGLTKDDIYAEVLGYGLSGDASHITAPSEDGNGARRAMESAISRTKGKVTPNDIDYVNAHATSTVLGDKAENRAFNALFDTNDKISISSTKSSIGHLLGAAGAVESIFTIKSVKDNKIPATLNLNNVGGHGQDDKSEFERFDYVPNNSKEKEVNYALNNSFGFGGVNSSLCFGKYKE